ncbi:sulfurtransferase [Phenylobacterium sp.]|jgi:thiosulfate/3-mercaptopyruvate sulfurtransferase|uniref:sulfurtransferase n=1 Tax=Phenylobacterium sp. TaxID=1871053 RepID=UPI002E36872C|nr:rhodanese-like domain-containing protein [Phenylobacterium sp.]HEX3363643.1 rhodanese-like domain-containing protein [Phenylobacterium sp.]
MPIKHHLAAVTALGLMLAAATPQAASAQSGSTRAKMLVSADWLKAHDADKGLIVLYVGDRKDYDAGHIPGAEYVSLLSWSRPSSGPDALTLELPSAEDLRAKLQGLGVSDKSRVIVYAGRYDTQSATRILFTLEAAGLGDRAALLDGGMTEWQRLGYPTNTAEPKVTPGVLAPVTYKARVVDAAFVQSHAKAPGYRVIDARAPAFYDGVMGMNGLKGHVPGAASLPFSSVTGVDQKLKSADELTAEFKAAGVKPGDHVVAYCHVGQQATAVIFAARSLGIDAVLYDGSFEDWSRRKLPVEAAAVTAAK